jgi:GNAT superfamily N-acetyltransferase
MRVEASAFDSQHYGFPIGKLIAARGDGAGELAEAIEAARRDQLAVVFLRLAAGDPLCAVLDRDGHVPVDHLVTSTLGTARPPLAAPAIAIEHHDRLDDAADIAEVAAITRASMQRSHLHDDPRLDLEATRRAYAAWARNDVTGRAQRTLLARSDTALIGYLTVVGGPGTAMIDLVAVTPSWHGRGVGSALLAGFIDWIGDRDVVATVGTQADNPALRLYARAGFVPTAHHLTYHLWLA